MDYQQIAYLFALATGIVSSGAIGSLWAAATDEAPHFGMLEESDLWTPVRIVVVMLSGPTTLMVSACEWLLESPLIGLVLLAVGLCWSFFQGVVILTQLFGAS